MIFAMLLAANIATYIQAWKEADRWCQPPTQSEEWCQYRAEIDRLLHEAGYRPYAVEGRGPYFEIEWRKQ
jgi:hypothetical protein